MKRIISLFIVAIFGIYLSGCSFNFGPTETPTPTPNPTPNLPTSVPTITLEKDEITLKVGDTFDYLSIASAIGYYNDDLTSSIEVKVPDELVGGCKKPGEYNVTYILIIKGNWAYVCDLRVIVLEDVVEVVDEIAPEITITGKETYNIGDYFNALEYVKVTDNLDSNPVVTIAYEKSNLPKVENNALVTVGEYKIVYIAQDASGNTSEVEYVFEVLDQVILSDNLIRNANFQNQTPTSNGFSDWLVDSQNGSLKLEYRIENSKVILTVNNKFAKENYDNQFKQVNLNIEKGKHYSLEVTLKSSINRSIVLGVQNDVDWTFHTNNTISLKANEEIKFKVDFFSRNVSNNVFIFFGLGKVDGVVYDNDHTIEISNLSLYETYKAPEPIVIPDVPEGYKLVWSDEFNGSGAVDSTKWKHEIGGWGWGNNELQYYTSSTKNSYVEDGKLIIKPIKENYNGMQYTSARLNTNTKFDFKYGIVEALIQLPSGGGVWPAFWMLGSDIQTNPWPGCGEIDIMEGRGNIPDIILGTIHTKAYNHSIGTQKGSEIYVANSETTYNLYRLEWTENSIKISVNGNVYFTFDKPLNATKEQWPFDSNCYILLNCAMGGMFGGGVDPNFTEAEMKVDYVRVYQK